MTQNEINDILLSKKLNEFYLAVIENRNDHILSEEEYNEIVKNDFEINGDNKKEVLNLFEEIKTSEKLKNFKDELMQIAFSMAQIRNLAILTIIDNNVYDIANTKFIDLKRNKIICYDNLTNYYNEKNARIKVFTKNEINELKSDTALLDIDDVSIINSYEKSHLNQKNSDDLTANFISETKSKIYTLKK